MEKPPENPLSGLNSDELAQLKRQFPLLSRTDPLEALKLFRQANKTTPTNQQEIKESQVTKTFKQNQGTAKITGGGGMD